MSQLIENPATSTPDRFVIRPVDLEADVPRLVRLFDEVEAADQAGNFTSEAMVRARLQQPGHDPARDRWVVTEPDHPDRVIAHGMVARSPEAPFAWLGVQVHPRWRRRGLGSALLPRALARARALGASYANTGTGAHLTGAHAFLTKHGFRPRNTFVEMQILPEVPLADPVYPPGYTVRTYAEVNDLPTLLTAYNRGFIGHFEHHDETAEELAHWLTLPHIRPEGFFLAFGPAGDPAGICAAIANPDRSAARGRPTGYIDSLGVVPEHRRKGLGRALLLEGMRWLRANGQEVIELNAVGDNEMALPLYEGVGFAVVHRHLGYRYDLNEEQTA